MSPLQWFTRRKVVRAFPKDLPLNSQLDEALPKECMSWRQGDVFKQVRHIPVIDFEGHLSHVECPEGVVLVSQSCDASQPSRPTVQISPVVKLEGSQASEATAGKRPQFASIQKLGAGCFADLSTIVTIAKSALIGYERQPGVLEDNEVRRFAGTVSRKFGRFAFPDEVVACLDPLRKVLSSKASKPASLLGKCLQNIYSIRIESTNGWQKAPYEIHLIVVLEPVALGEIEGANSTVGDDLPKPPPGLDSDKELVEREILELLEKTIVPDERFWLWSKLAMVWALECHRRALEGESPQAVSSVTAEIVTVDDFPLSRVNATESLDLDYLSSPLPRGPIGDLGTNATVDNGRANIR